MRICGSGNVGIGTTSPGAKLEVAGQVKITGGAPGAGKVLTSDATGLASWQTISTHTQSHSMTSTSDHTAGNWKMFYSNGSGQVIELALGSSGQVLTSNSASSAPSWLASSGVPSGTIVMWSGSSASIPSGWQLCDGTNGTPDLMDKFIVGAGSTYAVGATGGEATHTLTIAEMPVHTHSISTDGSHTHTTAFWNQPAGTSLARGEAYLTGAGNMVYEPTSSSGSHTHTIGNSGGGTAQNNLPPYYALCYMMKL